MKISCRLELDMEGLSKAINSEAHEQEWEVGYEAAHAAWIEYGTEPHRIGEAGRKAIRSWCSRKLGLSGKELDKATEAIMWNIRAHGTAAHPYFRPAYDKVLSEVEEMFAKYGDEAPSMICFRLLELAAKNITMPTVNAKGRTSTINDMGILRASGHCERLA